MPEAHDTNDAGIQHFSATQSSEQVAEALSKAYPDKYEYDKQDFTTAPLTPPVEGAPQQLDAQGNVIPAPVAEPVVDPNAQPKRVKPGKAERQLARTSRELEATKSELAKTREDIAELRGLILGKQSAGPRNEEPAPVAVEEKPAVEVKPPAAVEPAKFEKARPKREDFFDAADPEIAYEDAVAEWTVDKREFTRSAVTEAAKVNEQRQEAAKVQHTVEQDWVSALTAARTEYTDFDEVIKKPHFEDEAKTKPLPIVNNAMMHVAKNSEMGAKILYWLGTHPKEANEIAVKTFIKDVSDTRAVEKSMRMIHKEFGKIEDELAANPPKPKEKPVKQAVPEVEVDDEYDEDEEEDERAVDPNLQPVGDPQTGKKVEQGPAPGAVDTKPEASQQPPVQRAEPKHEPVKRVGSRGYSMNRPVVSLPVEAVRDIPPSEYRAKRNAEGSTAAKG
jgi:hypothetical protein